jgi:outer membrane receptor protein involved in Fe transport
MAGAAMATVASLAPAFADDSDQSKVEKVTVTGSRIPRKDYTSNSPLTTVTAQQIKDSGSTTIDQLLNNLPQVVPSLARGTNNGGGGLALVDLRGLGPKRVLVLINGHRIAPSDADGDTDLNNIPVTLVERVEVITGGASAVYGSDAVAGVVNFVMKKDFEGAEMTSTYKISEKGDINEWQIDGTMGASAADGRGNVTLYGAYYNRDGAFQDSRDFAKYDFSHSAAGRGSSTGEAGRFDSLGFNPFPSRSSLITTNTGTVTDPLTNGGLPSACGSSTNITFTSGGASTARGFCNRLDAYGGDRYNFDPTNYLITPQERFNVAALGEYALIGDSVKGFINLFYTNDNPKSQLAPTPATGLIINDPNFYSGTAGANTFLLDTGVGSCGGAPAITTIQGILCKRTGLTTNGGTITPGTATDFAVFRQRMTAVGARQETFNVNQFQFISGLEGDLGDGWAYETYINFSRVNTQDSVFNDVFRDKMTNALRNCVVNVGLFGAGCHSIDFYGKGDLSAADAAYIRIPVMTDITQIDRTVFSAAVTGSPLELPAGSLLTAFGFEYREDSIDSRPDQVKQAGNLLGFNRAGAISGSYDVSEVFAEVEIPIVKDVPLFHELTANLAYRLSDYSSVGQTETYHTDLTWEPIESLKFRGSYQRADRAPNLNELFQNNDQSFPPFTDRCKGTPSGALLTQCQATYLAWTGTPFTTPFIQTNSQIDTGLFGNTGLKDEKSDTYTIGLVFQPTGWKSFRASVDWYQINVDGFIGREFGSTQGKIDECLLRTVGAGGACTGISRTASGDLVVTNIHFVNLGSIETSGVDVAADIKFNADDFGLDPSWGSLGVHLLGTWVDYYDISGSDVTGTATEAGTLPEYQASASFTYSVGDFRFYWSWRYIDHVVEAALLPSVQYNDIAAEWNLSDHVQFYGGVNNLWDTQPPMYENGNSNTDTARYDIEGRTYFVGATIRY